MAIEETNNTEIDAFDAGWDEVDNPDGDYEVEVSEEEPETETEEDEADQQDSEEEVSEGEEEPETEGTEEEKQEEADQPKPDETFELKYMGETLKVGKNEVIALAQMGKDYDRIKAQRDEGKTKITELENTVGELKKLEGFIDEMCAASNMKRDDFIDASRAQLLVQQEKDKGRELSPELALEWATKQREQTESAAAAAEEKPEEETPVQSAEEAKRTDDFTQFAMTFPDVDAEQIPQEVWDAYRDTGSLLTPYALYENKQLKEKIKTLEQNEKNRERSTGSRKSSGSTTKTKDAFDEGWDSY